MELKDFAVGQKWKTRDDGIALITKIDSSETEWPITCDRDRLYAPNGAWDYDGNESARDLVSLIEDVQVGVAPVVQNEYVADAVATLQAVCHNAAADAGWWTNKDGTSVRDNPMCFSQKLMLIVSEVAEAMEGDRKNLMDDKLRHRPMREVELADALIRIFDLAGAYDMDLAGALVEKMAFNAVRPDHQLAARQAEGGKTY